MQVPWLAWLLKPVSAAKDAVVEHSKAACPLFSVVAPGLDRPSHFAAEERLAQHCCFDVCGGWRGLRGRRHQSSLRVLLHLH